MVADCGPAIPHRPLCDRNPLGDDGLAIQRIKIPKGEMSSDHLAKIADLAEMYGDKFVYSTNRQNLELHGVDPAADWRNCGRKFRPWGWRPMIFTV